MPLCLRVLQVHRLYCYLLGYQVVYGSSTAQLTPRVAHSWRSGDSGQAHCVVLLTFDYLSGCAGCGAAPGRYGNGTALASGAAALTLCRFEYTPQLRPLLRRTMNRTTHAQRKYLVLRAYKCPPCVHGPTFPDQLARCVISRAVVIERSPHRGGPTHCG